MSEIKGCKEINDEKKNNNKGKTDKTNTKTNIK